MRLVMRYPPPLDPDDLSQGAAQLWVALSHYPSLPPQWVGQLCLGFAEEQTAEYLGEIDVAHRKAIARGPRERWHPPRRRDLWSC